MKNIAIFVSGEGEAALRIVKLFNEGNRLKTVAVVADSSASRVLTELEGRDITLINVDENGWIEKSPEIANLLRKEEVKLIVSDNFSLVLPDEIMEATDGQFIKVSSASTAPKEVVAALEADLRKPQIEEEKEEEKADENPSPEQEWAETLKIQFKPPRIPEENSRFSERADDSQPPLPRSEPFEPHFTPPREPHSFQPSFHHRNQPDRNQTPMPSTWLIWSVLATIFCCFIPGIVAIIFSSQVSAKYYAGDIEGARRASKNAEIWIIASVVLGVISATLYLPFMLLNS